MISKKIALVFITLVTFLLSTATSGSTKVLGDSRSSSRGAGFLEYMLMAAIAVFLYYIIRLALGGAFESVLSRIGDALSL